jgi:hypothetical protein
MSKLPGTTTIQVLRKGGCNDDLGAAIEEVTDRVKATGKPGKVVLTLTIEPAGIEKGGKDVIVEKVWVEDDIKTVLPKTPQPSTLLFVDPDGGLTREDPQRTIPGIRESV